jgi:hypothetical protein
MVEIRGIAEAALKKFNLYLLLQSPRPLPPVAKFMLGKVRAYIDMLFGCQVERRWLRSLEVLQGVGRDVMSHAGGPNKGLTKKPT